MTFDSWEHVATFALTLPATEAATSYNQPAIKTRGKLICSTGHEAGSFHIAASHAEKAVLIDSDPETFWQTPHHANWPGLLARHGSSDPARIRIVITRAWWDRSTRVTQAAYGPRP
ncbi:hypothetical protein ASE95_13070 [Sphingomonas sp. Leaf231]|uniref:hypothetical protein n=1 Tax=Sphingomonas sp. Leaf231 TaxID=1736301 RepID=UPI0006FA4A7E|nr:hypothetical protein [Sphingomonas sp. Leaf231]KQN90423.1 hypothetical protein ASE95_13070 [Sphingomonas sp. Leaf231]